MQVAPLASCAESEAADQYDSNSEARADLRELGLVRVDHRQPVPSDLVPGLQKDAEVLLREKKISAIPDWNKALRPELWAKAKA